MSSHRVRLPLGWITKLQVSLPGFHVYNFLVNCVGEIDQGHLGVDVEVSPQDDCIYDIKMYLPRCQIPDSCSRAYNAR